MMACLILPVAWLSVGWSRAGTDVTMESMGTAVYAMVAAIRLPLAWLRRRRKELLWFSSHMLMFVAGLCILAAHLLPPFGPRFQLALLALACAASALTLTILEIIALLKRIFVEDADRTDPDSTEAPDSRATWSWASRP